MAAILKKPILVGGLGLTAGLWALQSFGDSALHAGGDLMWGTIALGSGYLWLRQYFKSSDNSAKSPAVLLPIAANRTVVEQALTAVDALITQLQSEPTGTADSVSDSVVEPLRTKLAELNQELDRQHLTVTVLGESGVGKTALMNWLQDNWLSGHQDKHSQTVSLMDSLPAINQVTDDAASLAMPSDALTHDLLLFLTSGDLTDSQFQILQQLRQQRQRVLLVFSKQDQYLPDDRLTVLHQLQQRVKSVMEPEDVVAIATVPAPIKVRQHQDDGSIIERTEQPEANVFSLSDRLGTILHQEAQQLVWATVLRKSWLLRQDIVAELNQIRRDRALPMIEQSQWIAAAAAFANPVPTLDLLATAAVNAQLVMDLGAVYHQPFSMDQAKEIAGTMAAQMVKLGLVEVSTQAISPLLKGSALTYVAGGMLQGVSAAYLTRIAGLSLVEYLQERSQNPDLAKQPIQIDRILNTLKSVFQSNQRTEFLQQLVTQGMTRLLPTAEAKAEATI